MPKPLVTKVDQHLGSRVRKLRQQKGISASTLAEAVGSTQQQISRYENGENKLSAAQLYRIARSLDTPISWFFHDADELQSTPLLVKDRVGEYNLSHRETTSIREDLGVLNAIWPQLNKAQRETILKLLDTFLSK